MKVTVETAKNIADLARLKFTDDELEIMAGEMTEILNYVEIMNSLDLETIEPLATPVPLQNVFREDKSIESGLKELSLAVAPEHDDSFFIVPKVIKNPK